MAMGNGTLPLESFKGYLVQDYLYLVSLARCVLLPEDVNRVLAQIHFARANALAAYKSKNMANIAAVRPLFLLCRQAGPVTDCDSRLLA